MKMLVGENLADIARSFLYPESSICILSGNEEELKTKFPDTYKNLLSCSHNRDKRTPMEYGRDLVASWLFEDFLINGLKDRGLDIEGNGADKNREILGKYSVSSSSDCIVRNGNSSVGVEIINDYNGWWNYARKIDLRDRKYEEIVKSKSVLLCISNTDGRYMLFRDIKDLPMKYIPEHKPYGGKPAYSLDISNCEMKKLDLNEVAETLKEIV